MSCPFATQSLPRFPFYDAARASFLLNGPEGGVFAMGIARVLPSGPLATLAERAAAHFAGGGGTLMGALPYDRRAGDYLFTPANLTMLAPSTLGPGGHPALPQAGATQAGTTQSGPTQAAQQDAPQPGRDLHPEPSAAAFRHAVAQGLVKIESGELDKIVLSRSLTMQAQTAIAPAPVLAALANDASVTQFLTRLPARNPLAAERRMIGATPELLVSRQGRMVASHPLAGSARRHPDPAQDEAAGRALLASAKDLREHAHAAEAVLDTLSPYCRDLDAHGGVSLRATARMWHLGTRITGTLRDPDTPVTALLADLHPTPAVCGLPREAADRAISTLEGYDRGFYAGAVGWADASGDGAWFVTLRCAEIEGDQARLYAGAGVVAGSTPEEEEAETAAKFRTILDALAAGGAL